MKKGQVLITGACGEIGHGLIDFFHQEGRYDIVGMDLQDLPSSSSAHLSAFYKGNILDKEFIRQVAEKHSFDAVFHLAAILSTEGEKNPLRTHAVNVEGAINLIELARAQSSSAKAAPVFVFPSTIAVYGLRGGDKEPDGGVAEDLFLFPSTMYGINKLYVENLGHYFSRLASSAGSALDFRCIRLPGVVSSQTVPSGGTSDYFPEMIHAAAQGKAYDCFVNEAATLPFMVMPDAVKALVDISRADRDRMTRTAYNVGAFSITAREISREVQKYFPAAQISFKPNQKRQDIVDSWPSKVDDSAARRDWNWHPAFDREAAFQKYLIPQIAARYGASGAQCCSMQSCA